MTIYEKMLPGHLRVKPFSFGNEVALNLYDCEPERIRSRDALQMYAREVVHVLDMKAYGEPIIEHFGHADPITSGFTLIQLIETSSISGHFSESEAAAFINIFSCKPYDMQAACEHAADFFKAEQCQYWELSR